MGKTSILRCPSTTFAAPCKRPLQLRACPNSHKSKLRLHEPRKREKKNSPERKKKKQPKRYVSSSHSMKTLTGFSPCTYPRRGHLNKGGIAWLMELLISKRCSLPRVR